MVVNVSDDYDDIIDEISKLFKLTSDLMNVDFIIFSESDKDLDPNKKNTKGIKISYHYESGMNEPDIKIEGDMDEKEIREYLTKYNIRKHPIFKNLTSSSSIREIDANELSLETCKHNDEPCVFEPYTEINDFDDFSEIFLEVPGIEKEDIILSFTENGRKLSFSARGKNRNYLKNIYLPFKSSIDDYTLEVNNGIATLKVMRKKVRIK